MYADIFNTSGSQYNNIAIFTAVKTSKLTLEYITADQPRARLTKLAREKINLARSIH
jgi:hypothetical protein